MPPVSPARRCPTRRWHARRTPPSTDRRTAIATTAALVCPAQGTGLSAARVGARGRELTAGRFSSSIDGTRRHAQFESRSPGSVVPSATTKLNTRRPVQIHPHRRRVVARGTASIASPSDHFAFRIRGRQVESSGTNQVTPWALRMPTPRASPVHLRRTPRCKWHRPRACGRGDRATGARTRDSNSARGAATGPGSSSFNKSGRCESMPHSANQMDHQWEETRRLARGDVHRRGAAPRRRHRGRQRDHQKQPANAGHEDSRRTAARVCFSDTRAACPYGSTPDGVGAAVVGVTCCPGGCAPDDGETGFQPRPKGHPLPARFGRVRVKPGRCVTLRQTLPSNHGGTTIAKLHANPGCPAAMSCDAGCGYRIAPQTRPPPAPPTARTQLSAATASVDQQNEHDQRTTDDQRWPRHRGTPAPARGVLPHHDASRFAAVGGIPGPGSIPYANHLSSAARFAEGRVSRARVRQRISLARRLNNSGAASVSS